MPFPYVGISRDQYDHMIADGAAGGSSPLLTDDVFAGFMAACKERDIDERLMLAWLRSENNMATNISAGLLAVKNAAGIKYVGQSRAYQSDQLPPSNEQGVYAGFRTWNDFFYTLAVNIQTILPDAYASGDLGKIASYYTTGDPNAGGGGNKVTFYHQYLSAYPPNGAAPVSEGVFGEDVLAKLATQIGHERSGSFDTVNGDHLWAYYCLAAVQAAAMACGLSYTLRPTAIAKYQAAFDQGLIQTGTPEHGAQVFLGTAFYSPDGHTGLWDSDRQQMLCTLTDGTGVGYRNWGPGTVGYLGWMRIPGVVAPRRPVPVIKPPDPPMDTNVNYVPAPNPYNTNPAHPIGVGGANKRLYMSAPAALGLPVTNEFDAYVFDGKVSGPYTLQVFENLTTLYDHASDTLSVVKPGARIIPKDAHS